MPAPALVKMKPGDGVVYPLRCRTGCLGVENATHQPEPGPERGTPAMTTPKQAEANRRNARQSTGPRTQSGKDRSRFNALKQEQIAWLKTRDSAKGPAKLKLVAERIDKLAEQLPD